MVLDPSIIERHGLSSDEYARIVQMLGREPTMTELGIFSVMWSEHCSYKSSRVHLRRLPTTGKRVLQGPGENAGAVDIGDGLAAVFKIESHNHPSFIEPYQGAATGVGGIIRDIFTMGARPIALLNSLRFGPLERPDVRRIMEGVTGWAIGNGEHSRSDAVSLYDKIERVVLPLYAARDGWIKIMKGAISRNASLFHSHRMMRRYAADAYFG